MQLQKRMGKPCTEIQKKKNLQSIILGKKVRYRTVCRVYDFYIKIGENNIYVCIYSDIKSKYRKNT